MARTTNNVSSLENVTTYAENILSIYNSVDALQAVQLIASGMNWYSQARDFAATLAVKTNTPFDVVVGVIAVLSPNQQWSVQLRYTELFIASVKAGIDYKSVGYGYSANRAKAAKMLAESRVFPHLSGIKVTSFYRNILGDYSTCTIDLWAIRIALGNMTANKAIISKYDKSNTVARAEIDAAYIRVAKSLNLPLAVLQAVVWTIARGTAV